MIPLWTTTGTMTSFSLAGWPSASSLRIPPTSFAGELCAMLRLGRTVAVTPKAESMEANCAPNVRRVTVKFIFLLLKFIRRFVDGFLASQSAKLLDRLGDRFQLFDHGIHRVLFEIHLLREGERFLGLCPGNHHDSVAVCDHNVSRIDHYSIAGHRNLRSSKFVVVHGCRWHNAGRIHWERDLAQIRNVANSAINYGSGITTRRHGGTHQPAHPRNVLSVFDHHDINGIGGALINRRQHSAQRGGVGIAFVFLKQYGSGETSKLGGEEIGRAS